MPAIIHIKETESTNSYIKDLLLTQKLEEGLIVVAENQSKGRGQRGNSWESEDEKNLTFSTILYPSVVPIAKQFILSQVISLAIKHTLDRYTSGITIKWPNDIYWKNKKICGILIENTLSENKIAHSIIGIGVNINQENFKSDAPNPVSLKNITKQEYDLNKILIILRDNILSYYQCLIEGRTQKITEEYKTHLFRNKGFHLYKDENGQFQAKIEDIEEGGNLILKTKEGKTLKFAFKEVKYIL